MDSTQQFVTKVDNMSAQEARTNFSDLFNEALAIEVSQWRPGESHEPGSASGSQEPSSLA
jgi:hypothetical protein